MNRRWQVLIFAAGMAACLPGCGGGDRVQTYPVTGTVVDPGGKPIPDALVVLHSQDDRRPDAPRPQGKTAVDGKFTLTTFETGDGAPAGNYRVTVQQFQVGKRDEPPSNRLPVKYSQPDTSGIDAAVPAKATELTPFQVKR